MPPADLPTVIWNQVRMGDIALDNWVATIVHPVHTKEFAIVCRHGSTWTMELFPKGRIVANPRTYLATYASLEKAQAHVERWAVHHWQSVRLR